jgi:hypothetical protein
MKAFGERNTAWHAFYALDPVWTDRAARPAAGRPHGSASPASVVVMTEGMIIVFGVLAGVVALFAGDATAPMSWRSSSS